MNLNPLAFPVGLTAPTTIWPGGPMDLSGRLQPWAPAPDKNAKAELEDEELWKEFDDNHTEMVITKAGRSV